MFGVGGAGDGSQGMQRETQGYLGFRGWVPGLEFGVWALLWGHKGLLWG